jgi:glutaredoxin
VEVVLFSRPGCHLCDEARAVLEAQRTRSPFDLREVDVETDDALELAYGIRIPVVLIDGEERFEIAVDPEAFAAAVGGSL